MSDSLEAALQRIADRAQQHDISGDWPVDGLADLANAGALAWGLPAVVGGADLSALDLHLRYEQLARASVSDALILSQRDAAVGLIDTAADSPARQSLLGAVAQKNAWTTVGIAQLTTSRQGGRPALIAEPTEDGFILQGEIPWATAAAEADFLIAGAHLEDRRQILFALPRNLPGVSLVKPPALVALSSTRTTSLRLDRARVGSQWLLRSPCDNALAGRKNALTLGQTFIANGLTQSAIDLLARHRSDRSQQAALAFDEELQSLRNQILLLCEAGSEKAAAVENARLRGACNDLAVRITHAAISIYKGSALLLNHPAQRLAREAMFLLVWSCPDPVIDCTVDLLIGH